jgi:hypothetical protein
MLTSVVGKKKLQLIIAFSQVTIVLFVSFLNEDGNNCTTLKDSDNGTWIWSQLKFWTLYEDRRKHISEAESASTFR